MTFNSLESTSAVLLLPANTRDESELLLRKTLRKVKRGIEPDVPVVPRSRTECVQCECKAQSLRSLVRHTVSCGTPSRAAHQASSPARQLRHSVGRPRTALAMPLIDQMTTILPDYADSLELHDRIHEGPPKRIAIVECPRTSQRGRSTPWPVPI